MATIVTRAGKGSPLTNDEVDANFNNLNAAIGNVTPTTINGVTGVSSTLADAYSDRNVVEAQDYGVVVGSSGAAASNSTIINNLMAGVSARGGGILQLPPGDIYIASTLDNKYPRVQVWGAGTESFHDSGSPTFGTRLVATTATTMLKLRTPYAAEQGVAASSTWKYTGGGFKYLALNGGAVATKALLIDSVSFVDVDVFATNFNAAEFYTLQCGVTGTSLGEACDIQFSKITLRARAIDTTADKAATICRLTAVVPTVGAANANVSLNRLPEYGISVYAQHWSGNVLTADSADNNDITLIGVRAGGTGYLAYMKGPTSTIATGGDSNNLHYVSGGGALYAEGTDTAGVLSGIKNRITNYDNGNGTPEPTAGTGSIWAFTRMTDNVHANEPAAKLAIADYANDAGSTRASMGSESLRVRNSASNHVRLTDTVNEWGVNIDGANGNLRFNRVAGTGTVSFGGIALPPASGGTGITSPGILNNVLTSNGAGEWVSAPPSGGSGTYANIDFTNVLRTVNKAGSSGAVSTYATAQNPLTADGRKRIIAGRDFGLALNGSTDDAPALNDIIQKVGARGGGYIDIAADLTPGGSAYMKILSSINNNVPGVTVRGTHFPSWSEFRADPLTAQSGVTIVPGFNGIACYHFTPFSNTAPQITGGGFEYLTVWGSQTGSGSSQELLRVDGVGRGSYIMNLMNPSGPTCARFIARDPDFISSISNTSIQYAHVDLYCRSGFISGSNNAAHGVIMQTSEAWTDFSRSGNVSLNRGWRILYEGVNGKALWNRSGDANSNFTVIAGQAGYPGVNELIWGSVGTGGTSGTYSMSFSGGTAIAGQTLVAPTGTFTVAGGKITSYTFTTTGSGYDKIAAPPTVSFAACPGLSGASATCVIGVILYHADAAYKSKASVLGGQSQGFDLMSGYLCPIILEGTNAPSAGSIGAIDNGAASGIFSAYIDNGNGTPQPTIGTQAYAKTRDAVYGIDYNAMSVGTTFGSDQLGVYLGKKVRSAAAPFTTTSYGSGIAAEFLMGSNTIDLRLEDDSTGTIRLRDTLGVLTRTSIWSSLQALGGLEIQPTIGTVYDPTANGRMTFETASDTQAYIKVRGSDGVVRKTSLPLSVSGASGTGTVTSVAALTLGTTGTDLSSSVANSTTTPVITLNVPTASATARGALSAADWSTFNGKQSTGAAASFTSLAYTTTLTGGTGVINIGSGQFYKDASGNIGISTGTTTSSGYGSGSAILMRNQSGVLFQGSGGSWNTTNTGGSITYFSDNNLYIDAKDSASTIIFRVNGANERMRIASDGNVGIGTVSPGEKLSIAGSASVFMSLLTTGTIKTQFYAADATGTGGVGTVTNHAFTINANNAEKMRVEASGNVGIGVTPAATALLDVQSTTKGVRFPNMTTTQKNAIGSPALGLVVFDTTLAKLCVYAGTWQTITST